MFEKSFYYVYKMSTMSRHFLVFFTLAKIRHEDIYKHEIYIFFYFSRNILAKLQKEMLDNSIVFCTFENICYNFNFF